MIESVEQYILALTIWKMNAQTAMRNTLPFQEYVELIRKKKTMFIKHTKISLSLKQGKLSKAIWEPKHANIAQK